MEKMMERLFKILVITITLSLAILILPIGYAISLLACFMYCYNGNIMDMISIVNDAIKDSYLKPVFELIKEVWDI